MTFQQGILLPPGNAGEPSQLSLPSLNTSASEDASILYATLFETTKGKAAVEVQRLPINQYLQESDQVLLIHASTSSSNQPVNRLANEVLLNRGGQGEESSSTSNISVKGKAYLLYGQAGKDFNLKTDWTALHDVCYGAHLAKAGKQVIDLQSLANEFITKRDDEGMAIDKEAHVDDEDWTDEDVEKPREPKKEVESDDEDGEKTHDSAEGEEADEEEEEEEEDSEGSYEDESELESDDDDDPRKKALLEMIQQAIMTDGELDLDRLGLVKKNGKLVPKDD